ncbi:hypothetical protein N7457_006395 [Penicillium paradoxum]|uniref:uncharacterized protein n=1 Tax=Penicillium paradoxum TaxID=176176 RepID=UPI0025497D5D|nr:uncharacterized protein N7457_006395 [Penicillium paradoxum]KAJ5781235.1 hypothetical protein N7457_006395 [Penicillium paradoxum]
MVANSQLYNLPVELLDMVFQNLRGSQHSLNSLAHTCRKFHELTIPILYSSIFLTDPASCEQLYRTIQKYPTFCSYVLELQVHRHHGSDNPFAAEGQTNEALLDVLWELPNLEALILKSLPFRSVLDDTSHRLLRMFIKRRGIVEIDSDTQYVGQKLRSLYLGSNFSDSNQNSWLLGPNEVVFYMTQLEKLCIQGARIERMHHRSIAAECFTDRTFLKELVLLDCDVSPRTLFQILNFIRRLTHFTMRGQAHALSSLDMSDYIRQFNYCASVNIEHLEIDIVNAENSSDFYWLENLKHLTLSPEGLQGYQADDWAGYGRILPDNLETLTLKDSNQLGFPLEILLSKIEGGSRKSNANVPTSTHVYSFVALVSLHRFTTQILATMNAQADPNSSILTGDKNTIIECSLKGSAINNCWMKKSSLHGCVVSNVGHMSRITGRDSQLYDIAIFKDCDIEESTVRSMSFLQNSSISRSDIRNSSTISRSHAIGTNVSRTYLYKSHLTNCDVTDCKIIDSKFNGMILKNGVWKMGMLVGKFGVGGGEPVIMRKDQIQPGPSTAMSGEAQVVDWAPTDDIQTADGLPDYLNGPASDRPPAYKP